MTSTETDILSDFLNLSSLYTAGSQCSPVSLAAVLILTKSKTQLRLFPGQTNENKYPSEGVFFSSQDQGQKMRYVWAKSKRFDFFLNPPEKSSKTLHSKQALRSSKLSWGCFQAKPLKISTLVMELFFLVRIRGKKWDMSEQNPRDLIFSSTLTWGIAALVDGGGKIFLSPRKWETDLRWASDISRCVVEPNLSFWEHDQQSS